MSQVNGDRHSTGWAGGSTNKGTVALVALPSLNRVVPRATPLPLTLRLICFLLCVPGTFRAVVPSLELRASGFVSVRACVALLREAPQSLAAPRLTQSPSLLVFTPTCYGDSFFSTGALGWGALLPVGGPPQPRCPSRFLTATLWMWD